MSSRYSSCFSLTSPNIRSRSTCEKPRIAFSGVRSSCDMLARNPTCAVLPPRAARLFSSSSRRARSRAPVRSVDLLLEVRIRLLEARGHAVELVGERPSSSWLGISIRWSSGRSRSSPPRPDRLDRPDEPSREQDAGGDCQDQERHRAAGRCARARLERRERLAQRLLDEDPPAQRLDRLEGGGAPWCRPSARSLRVSGSLAVGAARPDLGKRREVRTPEHEVDVRMGEELAA